MVTNQTPNSKPVQKPTWQRLWDWLTAPTSAITDIGEQRSARLAASFLFTIAFFAFLGGIARFTMAHRNIVEAFSGGIGLSLFPTLLVYALARSKWYRVAIFIFSVTYGSIAYISMISEGAQANSGVLIFIYVPISLIVASTFLSGWAVFLLTGLNVGALVATKYFGAPVPSELAVEAAMITVIGVVLILLTNFRKSIEGIRFHQLQDANREFENLAINLEQRVNERTAELEKANIQTSQRAKQLQTITQLSETIAQVQDLNELFPATTELISERFGFYHVGVFLIDEAKEFAVLQAANSEGGKRMLNRGHKLKLGTGVVGYSAQTGQPRIALDVGTDAVFFNNPDLPNTHSEAALPLKSRGDVIGILDVQSTEIGAFTSEDLQVLTTLANQVSIAFENTRLLSETRAALLQVQEVYNEFTRTEWGRAVTLAEQPGFRYQAGRIEMLENALRTPEILSAVENGTVVANQPNGSKEKRMSMAVPVKLRGEVIGVLHIESNNSSKEWQQDEISLVEAVAERAAFAMENARLFQDARRRAAKEQLISQATSRISGALDLENILKNTAEELEKVLSGSEILIQFQNKEK
ncbi:MAG: GAF domain-containing protein [Anaerolineales bacterium]|nr:GAF domain-containing protein [Anaerolineales bacterium]